MSANFEILAPVGNKENLIAAVRSGANAVYLGVETFNARASADNFSFEELKEAVAYCHARNVKVNVTLNTILYDNELEEFKKSVIEIAKCGVDAVIVQDLGAAKIIKNVCPDLAIHASTQMAIHNLEGAILLKEQGFSRVILARELSFNEVEDITKNSGVEIEVFVHGALCVCLSGQCYASAFLGGRSGNRGRCAGTCRLPFSAKGDIEDNHLSLKDLSAMDMLPKLKEIGVACVKIEGRLRAPEYVSSAVSSAIKASNGEEYQKQELQDVFSRQGFTNEFLEGKLTSDSFGKRTKEDSQKTKQTLPKIRENYRREGQFVPVKFEFNMSEKKSVLSITDYKNSFDYTINEKAQDATSDFTNALNKSLSKLGGTPFYLNDFKLNLLENKFIPLSLINEARRNLCETLLEKRSEISQYETFDYEIKKTNKSIKKPKLIARFEDINQIPDNLSNLEKIIIPIKDFSDISSDVKSKAILELPRVFFNGTDKIKELILKTKKEGFNEFYIHNKGHIPLVKGSEIYTSFTLNISNSLSAEFYKELGVKNITLSTEITLEQISNINTDLKTMALIYAHIPLMLTKACPLLNERSCTNCNQKGFLTDRKGKDMPIICNGKIKGYREMFNPVALYMGDRIKEIQTDYAILSFTTENKGRVLKIIDLILNQKSFDTEFTRGLYYKASI